MNSPTDLALAGRLTAALAGAYTIEGEIGRGGMGVVYRARDERLERPVAIKVLPPELAIQADIRERFTREARTAARLSHPHIVPIYTVGEADGLVYFSMGYVDGESVAARLRHRGRLPTDEARRIMTETADALSAAHALAVIHRDIKPDNILLEHSRGRVMVTDFGIAKALSSAPGSTATLTGAGIAIGTPSYMSPEQAAGDHEVDGRSDIYSLGIVSYQMLTGELPFAAPTVAGILLKHITEPAPDVRTVRPEVPEDVALTIARCLEKDPEHRWPTADALRRALETGSVGDYRPAEPDEVVPATSRQLARRGRRGKRGDKLAPVDTGEPKIVQQVRARFASWVAVSLGCFGINIATGLGTPWFLFPMFGMAIGLLRSYAILWQSGYSWRDVLARPPAADAIEAKFPRNTPVQAQAELPNTEEFGAHRSAVLQVYEDRDAILKLMDKLPPAERAMLPEIRETVDGLYRRASEVARTLRTLDESIDPQGLRHIDERIAAVRKEPEDTERERRLQLLERQRQAYRDLRTQQGQVASHLESCMLAMQNVRFDLLRLRSAGIDTVLGDLTQATQQAKSLSRDVDHAIAAAGEVRAALE